ncbi:MAG: hypothetical protein J6I86_04405 [Bacteroidaceae bacterium]|nr:hypothetical protein [Bacteroidaceae bacterium]
MRQNRLQNKVAGSEFTLPLCAIAAIGMWWLPQKAFDVRCLMGLVLCLLTTYIVMETNARWHIIRIRTRMMACVWIVLAASLSFMHPLGEPIVAAAFMSLSYLLLFHSYQRRRPQLDVFHAFLMLGIGSFCAPVMLAMAIPFFLYLGIFLRTLTGKAFWAGVLGIIVPYWCYAVWCFVTEDWQGFLSRLTDMAQFEMPSLEQMTSMPFVWQVSAGVVALLSIISLLHYLSTNYDDKIRVRMYLYIYVSQTLLMMAYLVLQPVHYQTTMALLVCSASPLIAHYFSLSRSLLTSILFLLSLLLVAGMATLNLWLTSFTF